MSATDVSPIPHPPPEPQPASPIGTQAAQPAGPQPGPPPAAPDPVPPDPARLDPLRPDPARIEARATDFVVRMAFLGLFAWWSLDLVRPFLPVAIWAILLAVALYPAYDRLARRLGGRRVPAAALMTLAMLATILGPVSLLAANLADSVHRIASDLQSGALRVPPPPVRLGELPVLGPKIAEAWTLASTNLDEAMARYGPAILPAGGGVLAHIAALGADLLKFVLSIVIAGFLFLPGPRFAAGARAFASRIIAPRGAHFVDLAGATIRNVSRGVIGVALIQSLLAGLALMAAGVPGAGLAAFGVLVLGIVQIGAGPILLPVLIWSWMTRPAAAALVLTLILVPIGLIDNVLKPILMARGLTTPMLVILTGVIGGTLTHGLVGLFLGPIVLAVFYDLVVAWTRLGPVGDPPRETR